ncbi:hypothetical protein BCR43DRAFT_462823 [Syncephalastrum racemosum]|uniref:Sorting nexin-4 n=1 Tax=Syncephalastrum racemosum TaxID=13706 RepID=A0A1X2H229_SYNRA|nr:hypothetical protein BCR43DRAFT_462823 [Syncephalastrum racemosum]
MSMSGYDSVDWSSSNNDIYSSYDSPAFNPFSSTTAADYEPNPEPSTSTATFPTNDSSYQDEYDSSFKHQSEPIEYMKITISDPQKHDNTLQASYITYLITTKTTLRTFASQSPRPVRRRFQDFVWLYQALTLEHTTCVIPPLPEKHRMTYVKGGRFSNAFIERRRLGLQWFLDRIACHPLLQKSQFTRIFLEASDFQSDRLALSTQLPETATLLESLTDVLMNAFTKVTKPDQRFIDMRDYVDKLEDNLNTVEKLFSRIVKRQQDMAVDYKNFGWSIREISTLELDIDMPLRQFAETAESYSGSMRDMADRQSILFMNELHELLAYCEAVKQVLRKRDDSQIDFEELSVYLQRGIHERDRLVREGSASDNPKLAEVELRIQEVEYGLGFVFVLCLLIRFFLLLLFAQQLENEVARTSDITNNFSDQMTTEFETFEKAKNAELKDGLAAYADSHIDFYKKGIKAWEDILPVLENIQLGDAKGDTSGDENTAVPHVTPHESRPTTTLTEPFPAEMAAATEGVW